MFGKNEKGKRTFILQLTRFHHFELQHAPEIGDSAVRQLLPGQSALSFPSNASPLTWGRLAG